MNHAKRLLLECKRPLREIARQVGFSDEYYFNRRFRQMTGVPPGKYALSAPGSVCVKDWTGHHIHIPRRASRIIYHGETMGDLLALGATAIGGSLRLSEYSVYKHRLENVTDVGLPLDTRLTSALDPDLIIIANSDEQEYERIASIAPTLTFNSFAALEERLRTLGAWLDKEQEAERWLATFTARNLAMWQQLSTHITAGETASVLSSTMAIGSLSWACPDSHRPSTTRTASSLSSQSKRCLMRDWASQKLIQTNCLITLAIAYLCSSLRHQTPAYAGMHAQQPSLA